MQYFVYVLKSESDGSLYIGKTNNLTRRLKEHNSGRALSIRRKIPFTLLEYHECINEKESRILEKEFKKGYKREMLRKKYKLWRSAGAV